LQNLRDVLIVVSLVSFSVVVSTYRST